jgi:hypothetical protein
MNKFKIIMYLGIGIMLFHLIIGLRNSKYDFSIFGALLVIIGYLKYELWYIFYVLLFILILIEFYNDILLMASSSDENKNTPTPTSTPKPKSKSKSKDTK